MRSLASQSLLLFLLRLSLSMAQHTGGFLNTMPSCWQTCFQSTFPKCPDQLASDKALDCVCPQAASSTFNSLISCVKQGCDDYANPLTLTAPLETWQNACDTAGYPLSARAVQTAQEAEQSILSTYIGRSTLSKIDPTASSELYSGDSTSTVSLESRSTTITGTVSHSSVTAETGTSTASGSSSSSTHHADTANGSPLDVTNQANKERARSLLGLTICLLAGVAWF